MRPILRPTFAMLASAEGLAVHRHAVEIRFAPKGSAVPIAGGAGVQASR